MGKVIAQILSNEAMNTKGFIVLNNGIDWNRYKKNPILLRNAATGEHYGQPIGRVENIRLENGKWVGDLKFGRSALALQAKQDYNDGILNGVSIFGRARIAERNGKRYATYFEVWEISLVNIPSNPDAVAIRDEKEGLSAVEFTATEVEEVTGLSVQENQFINQFENKMTEEEKNPTPIESEKDVEVSLSALASFLRKIGLDSLIRGRKRSLDDDAEQDDRDAAQDRRDAEEDRRVAERREADERKDDADADKDDELARKDRREAEGLSATGDPVAEGAEGAAAPIVEEPVAEGLAAEGTATETVDATPAAVPADTEVPPTSLSVGDDARVFDTNTVKTQKTKKMIVPFKQYLADPQNAEKIQRVVALSASTGTGDGLSEVALSAMEPETYEAVYELAASMNADPMFMATVKNMTFQVNEGRMEPATETIQALASGDKSGAFVKNADLAKIVWLSLFVRQLFPSNTWADRVRRLSVRDREGIIWVESAVNPDIYFGDRAPINAPNYLYDDLPRGLERKVFSMQPIVWQSANSDILSYNPMATGTADAMAKMTTAIHNYWLEMIAEAVPAANHIPMSGDAFDSANRFVINDAAAGQLHGMTINDLLAAQGRFIARNLTFRRGSGVAVLAEPYFTSLQQNKEIQSILTQQLSNARPDGFTYSGFDVLARSIIAAYNTATSTVVDAETYFDKPVTFATGAIDESHVKPVLAATVYDIGLGFMPEEVVVAIGNTNIHMVADPNNYGWKMSMDVSTGAGTLRSNATGIVLYRPTVATGA